MTITIDWLAQQFPDLSALTPLAQGGQKMVFTASHATDGNVVLKLIKPSQDVERVQREIRAVQQVQSARVPKVLDAGVVNTPIGGLIWLREQRVAGETVSAILKRGPMAVAEVKMALR